MFKFESIMASECWPSIPDYITTTQPRHDNDESGSSYLYHRNALQHNV